MHALSIVTTTTSRPIIVADRTTAASCICYEPLVQPEIHSTTIVSVRRGPLVVIAGDGQVTLGNQVVKGGANHPRSFDPHGQPLGCAAAVPTASRSTALRETRRAASPVGRMRNRRRAFPPRSRVGSENQDSTNRLRSRRSSVT